MAKEKKIAKTKAKAKPKDLKVSAKSAGKLKGGVSGHVKTFDGLSGG